MRRGVEGKVSVKYRPYRQLNGEMLRLVERVGDGSIIKRFDRTPAPGKPTDVVCPHFLELKWAYGCPFDCAWCYLKGTLRFLETKTKPVVKDYEKIKIHLNAFFDETNHRNPYPKEVLNTGEIADSLMWENNGHPFTDFIIPLFETQNRHRVLFLTKSNFINNILKMEVNHLPIMSFTMNAFKVSKKWEKLAPPTEKRIEAAKKLSEVGYEVRIRIDPIVPIENWKQHYFDLIDKTFSSFTPERITMGSLRGLQSTINNCKDTTWVKYLKERSNWGRKIDFKTRFELYSTIINYLKEKHNFKNVAMCKETIEMWNRLGMDYREIRCNCTW